MNHFNSINQPINILLCEDNPGDVFVIRNSLFKSQISYNFCNITDGENVIAYLRHEGEYKNALDPHLLLLDLNLPKKNGFEVLQDIKADPKLKLLPVIVLTSSSSEKDMLKSYELNASCYVVKPFNYNQFVETIQEIERFWLHLVKLPKLNRKTSIPVFPKTLTRQLIS